MSVRTDRNHPGTNWESVGNQLHPHPSQAPKGPGVGVAETESNAESVAALSAERSGATAGEQA